LRVDAAHGCSGAGHPAVLTFINEEWTVQLKRPRGSALSRLLFFTLFMVVGLGSLGPSVSFAVELSPKTVKAFDQYVALAESRMKLEESHPNGFLYIENLPKPEYDSVMATLKRGEVFVQQVRTRDAKGNTVDIPDGMIHHWVGDVLIPGRTVDQVLVVLRDYDNFKNIYKPEIIRSRLISRKDDNDYSVYLRLQKKTIVTVTLDTWYEIHFTRFGDDSGLSRSVATRIQQVEDAGTPHEYLDPVGRDGGYLWRINSYWRYQQRPEGVIIEWESITLSRQIPFLIAWFVKPLVRNIAREAVTDMLTATRKAVLAEKSPAANTAATARPARASVHVAIPRAQKAAISDHGMMHLRRTSAMGLPLT